MARVVGDVGLAEEVAQEAFMSALEQWRVHGIPNNPGGWLMTTARRAAIDLIRRERIRDQRYAQLAAEFMASAPNDPVDRDSGGAVGDDMLSLVFVACHPILSSESRAALTLRMIGGLNTDEIARAFMVPTATMGQRISRAKRTLAEAHVPFQVPDADDLPARLSAVLEVVYLVFSEGYAATSGERWIRRDLAERPCALVGSSPA